MCGIAGVLDLAGHRLASGPVLAMIGALAHRGPDGETLRRLGPLVLAHRRLSILDPTPAGDQPMCSADGRYWVVHNGEIYNFLELADELRSHGHEFRTATDTEVILAAYAVWGPDCVTRFNGIWAFALWDAVEERLFLSRDRFGVKPLYLAESSGVLAFASEVKALLTLEWVDRTPDTEAIRDFLLDARVDHRPGTFFRGIRRLLPAHNLLVGPNIRRDWRYWDVPTLATDPSVGPSAGDQGAVEQFRDLLTESVSLQLRSDVAIGSCLSGGIDSSTIVVVADALRRGRLEARELRHHERDRQPQLAFFASFDDPQIDERRFVDEVVAATSAELHTITPDATEAAATLEAVVRQQDEPFGSTSIVAQYYVMQTAHAAGVKVLLDGQGADELLAGYLPKSPARYAGILRSRDGLGALGAWARHGAPASPARIAWFAVTNGAPPPTLARPSRVIRSWLGPRSRPARRADPRPPVPPGTVLARNLWRDIEYGHLPGLLRYEDRNSMAFGIEARVPFLDHRLAELALALPDRLKVRNGERKVVLRRAFADLLPPGVAARRDKIGFATPEERWLRPLLPSVGRMAGRSALERAELLRAGSMARAVARYGQRELAPDVFWRLLSVELWLRVVVSGEKDVL